MFIYKNKQYQGYLQIKVNAVNIDGTIISGCEFKTPLYCYWNNELNYIPTLEELKEKYGEGLNFVKYFEVIVSNNGTNNNQVIDTIVYANKNSFEITKIKKLYDVNDDMERDYCYMIYVRLFNNEHTKYIKYKFILWFDIFEVEEYFEKDAISKNNIRWFIEDYAFNTCLYYKLDESTTYYDIDRLKDFLSFCNETIKKYNRIDKKRGGIY